MFARRLVGVAVLIAGLVLILAGLAGAKIRRAPGDAGAIKRRIVYPTHLPDGPGRPIAERSCLMCHSPTLITQQHKDSTGWEKSVKLMETWGAPVPPAEHGELIRYLSKGLGPVAKK
jgi:hypothetical protein